jgi:hypothetical protein
LGNSKKVSKNSSWWLAQSAISTKLSQPARTPQKPLRSTSTRRCLRLRYWRRGSGMVCNCSTRGQDIVVIGTTFMGGDRHR